MRKQYVARCFREEEYRIALIIFRGSKFLRIAALKEFVEYISRICVAHGCYSAVAQTFVELNFPNDSKFAKFARN